MLFECVVVTPEQQVLSERVTQAILPAHDGLVGILPGRAPLLVKLGPGPLRIDLPDGRRRHYLLDGGVAQMKDDKLTILSDAATPAEQINAEAAQAELAEAMARRGGTDPASMAQREHQLRLARAKLNLSRV